VNIFGYEIRVIVLDDLIKREILSKQLKDTLHRDAGTFYTRFSKMNLGINYYSLDHKVTSQKHGTSFLIIMQRSSA